MRGDRGGGLRGVRGARFLVAVAVALVIALPAILPATARAASGPVAAYSFDEGSGVTAGDATGNGHVGAILGGATFMPGHTGSALLFNGTDASVYLGALGTFYQQGFTLEAWVDKTSANVNDVAVVGTWNGDGPMIWVDHLATRYNLTLGNSLGTYLDSGRNPVAGQWQHLAATYDGTTARFYIDGVQVASSTFTGNCRDSNVWRIGAYRFAGRLFRRPDRRRAHLRPGSERDRGSSDMNRRVAPRHFAAVCADPT